MRRAKRQRPSFDCLEDKTLLSTTTPLSDVQGLQQHISSDHLVAFLANLGEVLSTRSNVQQFAAQVLNTHETGDEQVEMAAMSANVLMPSDISQDSDKAAARTVLQAIGGSNFDQVLLSTLASVEATRATAAQQLVNGTSNTAIK